MTKATVTTSASARWEADVPKVAPPVRGELLCPAAEYNDAQMKGTVVAFGNILGTPEAPRVEHYAEAIPITSEIEQAWSQGPINPGEIVRTAGRCKQAACRHWDKDNNTGCKLIGRWIAALPSEATLPVCPIRRPHRGPDGQMRQCLAWAQHGPDACRRCARFAGETVHKPDDPLSPVTHATRKVYL